MSPNVCLFGITIILRNNGAEIALLGGTFAWLRKSPSVSVSLYLNGGDSGSGEALIGEKHRFKST